MKRKSRRQLAVCMAAALLLSSIWMEPITAVTNESETEKTSLVPQPIRFSSNRWAVLPKWTDTPVIDGNRNESVWNEAAVLNDFRTAFYYNSLGADVEYRVAYDDSYLYIGGAIARSEADTLQQIEVLIRPQMGTETYYSAKIAMQTSQPPALTTIWNPSPDVTNLSLDAGKQMIDSFAHAVGVQQDTVFVEAAIPLAAIAPSGVNAGDEWQLNVMHVHNLYTRPLTSWAPIRNADHWHENGPTARMRVSAVDQDRMGSIYFSRFPDEVVGANQEAIFWYPEETAGELLYTGFQDKRLTFSLPLLNAGGMGGYGGLSTSDVEMWWKAPGRNWEQLDDYNLTRNGTQFTLEFQHPAPLSAGLYQLRIALSPSPSAVKRIATLTVDREDLIEAGEAAYWAARPPVEGEPSRVVTWSEPSAQVQQIMELIPPQPGFIFVGLPEMPELYPGNLYTLSSDGKSIISNRTGTVYPNDQYKEDKALVVTNGKGETVSIPYYEGSDGQKYFLTAHLWYRQKARAISQTASLANTDPLGAARLLYEFAKAYEGYNPTVDRVAGNYHANLSADKRSGPPYAYWGGIWDRWWYNDLTQLAPLIRTYAQLKDTNVFDLLSDEFGEDVESKIVDGLILKSAEFVLTYPEYLSNMSFQPWKGLIEVGKALNKPDYIHRAVELIERMVSGMFMSDGYWQEVTPSYHSQTVDGLVQVTNMLRGWSDPEGYVSPRTGIRFDNLDMEQMFPIIRRAVENTNNLVYPDGKVYPITDTWASTSVPTANIDAGSFLLPAAKVGRLAGGNGREQTQVYLGFQPKYGHAHLDPLNLGLYALGQELVPDLGYTHNTFYRWFALSTMGHNTVVVDGANMVNSSIAKHGGNVEAFVPSGGSFQAMRAAYESAYAVTDEYSREPWFVPFAGGNGAEGYVLDLFRVSGGSRHEYTLQGDANRDAYFDTDMTLTEYGDYLLPPGTQVVLPVSNSDSGSAEGHYPGYIYIRDVQQAQLDGDRYELTLVTEGVYDGAGGGSDAGGQVKMKITGLLEPGQNELYLGRSPSLRSIRLEGSARDNNDEAVKYTMPKLVLRRDGTDLKSTFVTLLEPFAGNEGRIEAIDRLPLDQAPEGAVAVQVAYGNTIDIILSNPDHPDQPMTAGDVTMVGKMGLIRLVDGAVQEMTLVGGTLLRKGAAEVTNAGLYTGAVLETRRAAAGDAYDALVVDAQVPANAAGTYVVVTHPDGMTTGFEIGQVLHENGKSVLVLNEQDPGFVIEADGSSRQTYYPHLGWTGAHTFEIAGVKRELVQGSPVTGTGTITGTVLGLDGQPVRGASVHLTGYPTIGAVTDDNGMFTLVGVPAGAHRVTANRTGFARTVSDPVTIVPGGSAQLTLSFTKSLPPELYDAPPVGVLAGEKVRATMTDYGYVHLVPADTPYDREAIEAVTAGVYGMKAQAVPDVPVEISTAGAEPGKYKLYAISDSGLLSAGKNIVLLPAGLQKIEDTSELVTYVGRWEKFTNSAYSEGTLMMGREKGAYADIPFYGTSAKLITDLHTARGKAAIYVDGEYVTTLDQYGSPIRYQQEVFDTGPLDEGVHVIRIEALWDKHPSASGSNVTFDALRIFLDRYELTGVTEGAVVEGDAVTAVSPKDGTLYLVPADTPATRSAIEEAAAVNGRSAPVSANVPGQLDTSGLPAGWYKVYAIDSLGNPSEGSAALAVVNPSSQPAVIDDGDPLVRYTGDWRKYTNSVYQGGTMMISFAQGDYVDVAFYGTSAVLITDLHRNRGKGKIYLDGEYVETVDFYRDPILYQQETFATGPLPAGPHVLRIETIWEKSPDSLAYLVPFDALRVSAE